MKDNLWAGTIYYTMSRQLFIALYYAKQEGILFSHMKMRLKHLEGTGAESECLT